jgi:hypothetical protein
MGNEIETGSWFLVPGSWLNHYVPLLGGVRGGFFWLLGWLINYKIYNYTIFSIID